MACARLRQLRCLCLASACARLTPCLPLPSASNSYAVALRLAQAKLRLAWPALRVAYATQSCALLRCAHKAAALLSACPTQQAAALLIAPCANKLRLFAGSLRKHYVLAAHNNTAALCCCLPYASCTTCSSAPLTTYASAWDLPLEEKLKKSR